MSEFVKFANLVAHRFAQLSKHELYTVGVERDQLWETYLETFPEGTDPIFRVRTVHDGSYDRAFIRNVGHVVAIIDGKLETLWDIPNLPYPYDVVAKKLHEVVQAHLIVGVFRTRERQFGHKQNYELIDGSSHTFNHFLVPIENRHFSTKPDADRGAINTHYGVFWRGLKELTNDALDTVADLIKSNSIYRGAEFADAVKAFRKLKADFDKSDNKEAFSWANLAHTLGGDRINPVALFRNTVIGTLVVDLSEGVELEKAVAKYESKVAPQNYKRSSSLITPKMIEQAVAKLHVLGLEGAINRRFAKLSDVSVNNVLFVDNAVRGQMKGGLTDLLMEAVKPTAVKIDKAENISIDDFLANIVPTARSIKLLVENQHLGNFMSMTAPLQENTGKLFKWDNDFAWSYNGDVTDSIKERVKRAGGNIDVPLRVSLSWHNADDLDLHAYAPEGHIYYRNRHGVLDVDMNGMDKHDPKAPVENLSWRKPRDGAYTIEVHQYSQRRREDVGFEVEFYFNGETKTFSYPKIVTPGERITLASFVVKNGTVTDFKPSEKLSPTSGSIEKWGVSTETLVPVNTLLASPNHWDSQQIGNKHWFFILKDCLNPDQARGIYNEFLRSDLEEHRKVFEVLGAKTKTQPSTEQLSGVGFSSTRKDEAVVVVDTTRGSKAYRIKF